VETDQIVTGYVNSNDTSLPPRIRAVFNESYEKYLPSFNVASELGHGLVARAAASRTMTRPNPGDIAPNEALSTTGDQLTRGNPALAPFFSDNYDLGLEWYFGESGLGVIALNG
jgi:outer membrane receptor protein involved in Fe transport